SLCTPCRTTTSISSLLLPFFFFTDTPTPAIYTLSLHDALPISLSGRGARRGALCRRRFLRASHRRPGGRRRRGTCLAHARAENRSEEHTSELQLLTNLVCRLLLEKKKKNNQSNDTNKQVIDSDI